MRNNQSRHLRIVHSNSEAIAGNTRLSYFEHGSANPVSVLNANLIIGQTLDGEIFTKLSVCEVISAEFPFPILIGFDLINHHSTVFAAMAFEIALGIAVEIEPSSEDTAGDRAFPDGGAHDFALPCNLRGQANVNGEKFWQLAPPMERVPNSGVAGTGSESFEG
jgi:hypothetical protein